MARYAVMNGSAVVNVVEADASYADPQGWIAAPDYVSPGWTYDGSTWIAPPAPPAAPAPPVPVTTRQMTIIRRCTPDEANTLLAAKQQADAQLQLFWDAADVIDHSDPLFTILHDFIANALSTDGGATPNTARADALLAPSS